MRSKFDIAASIAAGQHGRVSWQQLVDEDIHRSQIQRWIDDRLLLPVHHGVYAVGHTAPSLNADLVAAVLACGKGAALSHASAAHLYRLIRTRPRMPHVTVPTTAGLRRPGIVIHRVRELPALDAWTYEGIRAVIVPRVLLDLAPRERPAQLTRMCHEAWVHHDISPGHVKTCVARNPGKPGIRKLWRAMTADVTLSDLEGHFVALLERHDLPLPRTNVDHKGDKVDCHWPEHGLTVELVTFRYHATRQGFEADVARRRRSNHIAYSYGDVVDRGLRTAREIAAELKRRSGTRSPE